MPVESPVWCRVRLKTPADLGFSVTVITLHYYYKSPATDTLGIAQTSSHTLHIAWNACELQTTDLLRKRFLARFIWFNEQTSLQWGSHVMRPKRCGLVFGTKNQDALDWHNESNSPTVINLSLPFVPPILIFPSQYNQCARDCFITSMRRVGSCVKLCWNVQYSITIGTLDDTCNSFMLYIVMLKHVE